MNEKHHFFPSAIFTESGSFLNFISEIIPKIGPITKKANPNVQPIKSTIIGKSQIVIFVIAMKWISQNLVKILQGLQS